MNVNSTLPLVTIVGPTASGKSALAIWLAERVGGEVIVCDSTQLYQRFDIGTGKPSETERRGVPHHLLDVLTADEASTAGRYRELTLSVLADLRLRSKIPILTVGTGLYLRALLEGLADIPLRSEELRERLRQCARKNSPGHLHRVLKRLDPETAGKIATADQQKLIRAIEVCLLAKRPISEVYRNGRTPLEGWRPVKIGLLPPREELYQRIHKRIDQMLEDGWLQEVKTLVADGLPDRAKPFDFIGYREMRAVLRGEMNLDEARSAIGQSTRNYAKRQLTWFRRDLEVHWLAGFGDNGDIQHAALQWLQDTGIDM